MISQRTTMAALFVLLPALIMPAVAQVTASSSLQAMTVLTHEPTPTPVTMDTAPATADSTAFPLVSATSHSMSIPALATATSTSTAAPAAAGKSHTDSMLKFYFVFLALFILVLGASFWALHRRRQKQKAAVQDGGADLESAGWTENARRLFHGVAPWRIGTDGKMAYSAKEEGLNELGEAPPPYLGDQKDKAAVEELHPTAMPPRTASRASDRVNLPGYDESERASTVPHGADNTARFA